MEETLHKLGILLVQSIPTILFFILMAVFLNATLFKPLARVLDERRRATEGVRELARKATEAADRRGEEFEKALQLERAKLQEQHGRLHQKWLDEQQAELTAARHEAEQAIARARGQISEETREAQATLDSQVQELSEQIVNSLLRRKAA